MRARVTAASVVVSVLALSSACAWGAEGTATATGADGALAYASWSSSKIGLGDSGLLRGAVVDSGGCLKVSRYTPILPREDPRWDDLRAGDLVSLRGGALDVAPGWASVPDQCADGPFWLVVRER